MSRRWTIGFVLFAALWALMACSLIAAGEDQADAQRAAAGDPDAQAATSPSNRHSPGPAWRGASRDATINFRRVYVPADRVEEWPRGEDRYVPMAAAEFENLLKAVARKAADGGPAAGRLLAAQYSAQLSGDDLLTGQARLQISHDATRPALVSLWPCGIAISNPRWVTGITTQRAELGVDQDGVPRLVVPHAGPWLCDWSLRGQRQPGGNVSFALQLPNIPSSRLLLDLPENLAPRVDFGVVSAATTGAKGLRRWQIDLGTYTSTRLTLVPAGQEAESLSVVRQTLSYRFSPRGLEVTARLMLDVHGPPLPRLLLDVDPSLRLMDARLGDAELPWASVASSGGGGSGVVLEFPEPLSSAQRIVQVRAVAPVLLGQRRTLPTLRPRGVFWQEGTATLLLPRPLALADLKLSDCRQTKVESLPAPDLGDSLELQYFAPGAAVEVLVERRESPLHVAAATSLELSPRQVLGRFTADCTVEDGERFNLTASLSPRWRIDAVESDPPGAIDQWSVQEGSPKSHLTARLARAITPNRPLRLTVTGHLSDSSLGRPIPHSELRMLDASDVVWDERIVGLRCRDPYRLHVAGDEELSRLDPAKLAKPSRARLGDAPQELVYADDTGAGRLEVSLLQQSPGHAADITVELRARDKQLDESYRIACRPDSGGMDRLLVQVSQERTQALSWSIEDSPGERLQTRRLTSAEQREAGFSGGEMWEVALQRPRTRPFAILAQRSLPFSGPVPAALVSVAAVSDQTGLLTVRSETGQPLALDNRKLKPIPTATAAADTYDTVRAAYRYDPNRDVNLGGRAPLLVAPAPAAETAGGAIVWRAWFDSRYDVDGRGQHAVCLYLENAGLRALNVELPPGISALQIWVDGIRVRSSGEEGSRTVGIDLNPAERFPLVRMEYGTQRAPLGAWLRFNSPLPTVGVPVHAWHGIVWTPPGYRVLGHDASEVSPGRIGAEDSSYRWTERLFGPLARPSGTLPFNPLSLHDWMELGGGEPDRDAARRSLSACLRQLGKIEPDAGQPLTLAKLLAVAGEGFAPLAAKEAAPTAVTAKARTAGRGPSPRAKCLVDSGALQLSGISTQTAVPEVAAQEPQQRGAERLLAVNLVLLVHGDDLVLTSADEAAAQQGQIVPFFGAAAGMVSPGPLAARLEQMIANGQAGDGGLVPLRRWVSSPTVPRLPWNDPNPTGYRDYGRTGWSATRFDMLQPVTPRLLIVRESLWSATGWSLLLLATAAVWWWSPRRGRTWCLLLSSLAIAALLLPPLVAPVASIGLWGTCAAGLLVLLSPLRSRLRDRDDDSPTVLGPLGRPPGSTVTHLLAAGPARPSPDPTSTKAFEVSGRGGSQPAAPDTISPTTGGPEAGSSKSSVTRLLLWLLVALAMAPCAAIGAGDREPAVPVYRVLIPMNKDKQPVGGTYYVPLAMFNELHQRAASGSVERRGWLVTGLTYRGRLAWNSAHTRLDLADLKAIYDVEVFGRQTQLRLPLRPGAVRLLVTAVTLDAHPIDPLWDRQGRVLLVDVAEPGRYRLELSLRALDQENEPNTSLELLGPALPTARLELTIPSDAPPVEVSSALGEVHLDASNQNVTAQLGGSGRLAVSWPQPSSAGAQSPVDVDQLLWLRVQPGAVTVETRLRLKGSEGRLHHFQLLADPRLRLLPLSRESSAVMQVHAVAGDPQTIVMDFPRGVSDDQELALSFLWTSTSGLGHMRVPLLRPVEAKTYAGLLAVSVDPQLRFDVPQAAALESASAAELRAHWDLGAATPELSYHLPRTETTWSLATRSEAPQTSVQQTVALSFSPDKAAVRFEADLQTTTGQLFQYRLNVPPGFGASHVSLLQADSQRVARWSQSGSVLTIFLNGPVDGSQHLSIRGQWPLASPQIPLPGFRLENCAIENDALAVYRRSGAKVQVTDAEALSELADPAAVLAQIGDPSLRRFGQFLGAYQVINASSLSPVFNVHAETTRSEAVQIVSLGRREGVWEVTIDYRLHVISGTVDVIRFEVPASLRGPLEVSPRCDARLVEMAGSRQRQLVIRPAEPVRDNFRLSIVSPLAIADGDRVGVPAVVPLDVNTANRFVVLPKQVELEQVHWEIRGLDPEPLPQDRQSPPVSEASVDTYRITGDRFQAVLASVARVQRSPRIDLADVLLARGAAGNCTEMISYDLEPAGQTSCRLIVPPGMKLVAAHVGDLPATLAAVGDNQWDLSLISDQLPQRIELLLRSAAGASGGGSVWPAVATLRSGDKDITVQQTLWSIDMPPGETVAADPSEVRRISLLEQQRQRLDSVTELVADATSEESIEALAPWYQRWARCANDVRRQLECLAPETGPDRKMVDKLLADNQRQQDQTAHRLRTSDVLESISQEPPRADRAANLWQWGLDAEIPPLRFSQAGPPKLEAAARTGFDGDLAARLVLAAALAVLAWLMLRTPRGAGHPAPAPTARGNGGRRAPLWPKAAVFVGGLLGWLFLWPGVIGLLLACGAGAATLRAAVRGA